MEILLAIGVFVLAVALLSLGSVAFRRPLRSSCGGVAGALGGPEDGTCGVCGRAYDDCPEKASRPEPGGGRPIPRKREGRAR